MLVDKLCVCFHANKLDVSDYCLGNGNRKYVFFMCRFNLQCWKLFRFESIGDFYRTNCDLCIRTIIKVKVSIYD